MNTFLLAWNPNRWEWKDLSKMAKSVRKGRQVKDRWGTGNSEKPQKGDRFFLIRLGKEPRGIFGSGFFETGVFKDLHWDPEKSTLGETAKYANIVYDFLLNPERDLILSTELLRSPNLSKMHWNVRMSGVEIPHEVAEDLETLWAGIINSSMS